MQRRILSHLGSVLLGRPDESWKQEVNAQIRAWESDHLPPGSAGSATSPSADGTTRYFATFDVAAGLEIVRLSDQLAALQAERDELAGAVRDMLDFAVGWSSDEHDAEKRLRRIAEIGDAALARLTGERP